MTSCGDSLEDIEVFYANGKLKSKGRMNEGLEHGSWIRYYKDRVQESSGEFYLGNADVEVGHAHGMPFYMSTSQFEYWEHTHLTLDAIKGTGGQFSLERPTGLRFIIRSRIYSDEEWKYLEKFPVKKCG